MCFYCTMNVIFVCMYVSWEFVLSNKYDIYIGSGELLISAVMKCHPKSLNYCPKLFYCNSVVVGAPSFSNSTADKTATLYFPYPFWAHISLDRRPAV